MNLTVAYRNRSSIQSSPAGLAVTLAANLRRDRVSFDAELRHPLRFREAIAALNDVLIGDQPKSREAAIRQAIPRASFDADFRAKRGQYWAARDQYARHLMTHDPEHWRLLVPSDPVITVGPDVLFLESFAADESCYACLSVDRGAFAGETDVKPGTTNVDYSWKLREDFPMLRSYRPTRVRIDPGEFDRASTDQGEGYPEERIDLPDSWLRGFLRLQSSMSLPMRRVPLGREGLYNILAFLKRHKAAKGPRAVRFELTPGRPVAVVLEPWEERIELHDGPYDGPRAETIRVWGRDRLQVLARLLPMVDEAEVFLLGTSLPSFWSVRMGEIRLMLGLSGWSANNRTDGSAWAKLAPPIEPSRYLASQVAASLRANPSQTLAEIAARAGGTEAEVLAVLSQLAGLGQVIHDLHAGVYRWRLLMPAPLTAERLGPESPETVDAREIARTQSVRVTRDETQADGSRVLEGQVLERPASLLLDADGRMRRGRCSCSHHRAGGLRNDPCRHLQALHARASGRLDSPSTLEAWFASLRG